MVLKSQLYSNLIDQNEPTNTDSLIIEIGKKQIEIEQIHYKHFQEIKGLCKPEQQKAFKELSLDIVKLFAHPAPSNEKK